MASSANRAPNRFGRLSLHAYGERLGECIASAGGGTPLGALIESLIGRRRRRHCVHLIRSYRAPGRPLWAPNLNRRTRRARRASFDCVSGAAHIGARRAARCGAAAPLPARVRLPARSTCESVVSAKRKEASKARDAGCVNTQPSAVRTAGSI